MSYSDTEPRHPIHGLMAEFETPTALLAATRAVIQEGYRKYEAYSPFPIEELNEEVLQNDKLPLLVLCGGITGLLAGLGLQYWCSVIDYPMNIGGRPDASWIAFIPPAYETTILFSAFAAVFGMLLLNGLPRPYHPVFNVERFALASRDRFFLCIESEDPKYERQDTERFLASLHPREVMEVAH
jgi:ActD protein